MQMNLSKRKREWEIRNTHSPPLFAALQAANTQTQLALSPFMQPSKPWKIASCIWVRSVALTFPAPPLP